MTETFSCQFLIELLTFFMWLEKTTFFFLFTKKIRFFYNFDSRRVTVNIDKGYGCSNMQYIKKYGASMWFKIKQQTHWLYIN